MVHPMVFKIQTGTTKKETAAVRKKLSKAMYARIWVE